MTNNNEIPVIDAIADAYNTRHKIDIGLARTYLRNICFMTCFVSSIVGLLTYYEVIDGAGATAIFGAVVGYIFGMRAYQMPATQMPKTPEKTHQK